MMLLLLLGPLRDAVACALEKTGGTDDSRKLRTAIGLWKGVAYTRKLERIPFLPRDYSIQPVVIACAWRAVRREWSLFSSRWLSSWRCICACSCGHWKLIFIHVPLKYVFHAQDCSHVLYYREFYSWHDYVPFQCLACGSRMELACQVRICFRVRFFIWP